MTFCRYEGRFGGTENMLRDGALLQLAEGGIPRARVYGWEGAWVSLGRFQQAERVLLPEAPVEWVQRPTGGKAVLHGHDVTVGLGVPLSALGLEGSRSRSLAPVYRAVVDLLVRGLRASGVPAALGEDTRFCRTVGHTADCFAHVAPNDVVDERTGQKVCGCALKLTDRAVLVQASIPAGPPLVDPSRVFSSPSPVAWVPVEPEAFTGALQAAWDQVATVPWGISYNSAS